MLETIILIGLMFLLIFVGVPICFAFAGVSVAGLLLIGNNPINVIPQGCSGE